MMFSALAVIQSVFCSSFSHCILTTYALLPAYGNNVCDPVLMALFWSLVSDLLLSDLSFVNVEVEEGNRYWV